jgi:hypothetical protein
MVGIKCAVDVGPTDLLAAVDSVHIVAAEETAVGEIATSPKTTTIENAIAMTAMTEMTFDLKKVATRISAPMKP